MRVQDLPYHRAGAGEMAAEQCVPRGEAVGAGFAFEIDGRADQLGEGHQLGMGVALRDGVAGDDDGTAGGGQDLDGLGDGRGVGPHTSGDAGRRSEFDLALAGHDVVWEREEDGAGWRRERDLGGTMHEERQLADAARFDGPFDEGLGDRRQLGIQVGFGDPEALRLLSRGDQHRRAGALRVEQHAHGVAQAGRDVEVDHAEAAGGAGIAVGHGHCRRFLQGEDVAQPGLGGERVHQGQLGGAWIAEHDLHAFELEQLEERAASRQPRHRRLRCRAHVRAIIGAGGRR